MILKFPNAIDLFSFHPWYRNTKNIVLLSQSDKHLTRWLKTSDDQIEIDLSTSRKSEFPDYDIRNGFRNLNSRLRTWTRSIEDDWGYLRKSWMTLVNSVMQTRTKKMSNYAKLTCLINDYRSALSIKKSRRLQLTLLRSAIYWFIM